jgi:hypothetical protein
MPVTALAAIITAATGLVAAVGALVAQLRHVRGPAHKTPLPPAVRAGAAPTPGGPGGSGPRRVM